MIMTIPRSTWHSVDCPSSALILIVFDLLYPSIIIPPSTFILQSLQVFWIWLKTCYSSHPRKFRFPLSDEKFTVLFQFFHLQQVALYCWTSCKWKKRNNGVNFSSESGKRNLRECMKWLPYAYELHTGEAGACVTFFF